MGVYVSLQNRLFIACSSSFIPVNSRLLKSIQHTEQKLSALAKKAANEVKQIEK